MERRTQLDRPAVSPFAAAALYLLAMAGLLFGILFFQYEE